MAMYVKSPQRSVSSIDGDKTNLNLKQIFIDMNNFCLYNYINSHILFIYIYIILF